MIFGIEQTYASSRYKKCQISRRELALCLLVVGEVNKCMTAVRKSTNNYNTFQTESIKKGK